MMTRDEKGKFAKGNPGGGRKPKAIEQRYLEIFKSAVGEEDWKAIVSRAVLQAKQGDAVARKFIADYLIGQPVQKTELSGQVGLIWDKRPPKGKA